ncbi:MAG: GIY-YIG nuclease family protein [Candidatus Thiodiazotropha endolucinida]|nr:GIY-YIG nuclease family protein [Candidatus Thiodiazotropha taylori]
MPGKEGKIYILRNPYLKNTIVKIGRTSRISEKRAKEISGATGVPFEYEVLYEEDVFDSHLAEKIIHSKLDHDRVNPRREFFQLPLKKAVKVVFETCLEVNKDSLEESSSRIIIGTSKQISKNLLHRISDTLYEYKGGDIGVYILHVSNTSVCLIKIGEKWNVSLSPELVNELRRLKGVSFTLWASRDVDEVERSLDDDVDTIF